MAKHKDLTKNKYGRLKPVRRVENVGNVTVWLCECDCGNSKAIRYPDLVYGRTVSCGCKKREDTMNRNHKHGMATTENRNRLYRIWAGMKTRCTNKNAPQYENYGARGIKVCDEWLKNFEHFRDWSLKNGYTDGLSIDRIDNDGNYEPSNCRWASNEEQGRNRRSNAMYVINEDEKSLVEWCEIFDIGYRTVRSRLDTGWDIERALSEPVNNKFRMVGQ